MQSALVSYKEMVLVDDSFALPSLCHDSHHFLFDPLNASAYFHYVSYGLNLVFLEHIQIVLVRIIYSLGLLDDDDLIVHGKMKIES
jgi:hypothetical protein